MYNGSEIRRRALSGVRVAMILNYAAIPLSFFTNVLFGQTSPLSLGYYSAVQLFLGSFLALVVLGGPKVFVRFVPALPNDRRIAFLVSYATVVVALFLLVGSVLLLFFPDVFSALQRKFGQPHVLVMGSFCFVGAIGALSSFFLYGTLEAGRAVVATRAINLGLLVSAALGAGPLRAVLLASPAAYVWIASLIVYAAAAAVGVGSVASLRELRGGASFSWYLPAGFWSVATYVHLANCVDWVYSGLSPSLVLFWLDVRALAALHAATRFPLLLGTLPATLTDVLSPGLAALEAAGERDRAVSQARTVVQASLVALVPGALIFTFFAGDWMVLFNPIFREHRDLLRIVAISSAALPIYHLGGGMLAAVGAFRAYLAASTVYVVAAGGLAVALIPTFGLVGAATASTTAAAVHQAAVAWVLRRKIGFSYPRRAIVAWVCLSAASATALWLDPGRVLACALTVSFTGAFAVAGRVTAAEVGGLFRRLLGRR